MIGISVNNNPVVMSLWNIFCRTQFIFWNYKIYVWWDRARFSRLQRSEQVLMSSQLRSHFFLHVNCLWQTSQILANLTWPRSMILYPEEVDGISFDFPIFIFVFGKVRMYFYFSVYFRNTLLHFWLLINKQTTCSMSRFSLKYHGVIIFWCAWCIVF